MSLGLVSNRRVPSGEMRKVKGVFMREIKDRSEPNIKVTPAPPHNPSAMPTEHRLLLRVLQGLREGEAIRLHCHDSEDTRGVAKVIGCFILRECKKGRLSHYFPVLRREEGENLVIYVIKGQERRSKGKT